MSTADTLIIRVIHQLLHSSYLQNPYYFMYASLMAADLDEELHLLRDGKTRSTTGSVVSSLYHLKDIDNSDAGFFVFPDISVRMEGSYRLKLSLFEIIGYVECLLTDYFGPVLNDIVCQPSQERCLPLQVHNFG